MSVQRQWHRIEAPETPLGHALVSDRGVVSFGAVQQDDGRWLLWTEDRQGRVKGPVQVDDFTELRFVTDLIEKDYNGATANPSEEEVQAQVQQQEAQLPEHRASQLLRTGGGALIGAVGGSLLGGIPGVVTGHTALTTLGSSVGSIVGAAGGAVVGHRIKNARNANARRQMNPQISAQELKNRLLK